MCIYIDLLGMFNENIYKLFFKRKKLDIMFNFVNKF